MKAGALGCSISGSGPSIFALCKDETTAQEAAQAMHSGFDRTGIESHIFVSPVNNEGVKKMETGMDLV
jgi:homoserine kinase